MTSPNKVDATRRVSQQNTNSSPRQLQRQSIVRLSQFVNMSSSEPRTRSRTNRFFSSPPRDIVGNYQTPSEASPTEHPNRESQQESSTVANGSGHPVRNVLPSGTEQVPERPNTPSRELDEDEEEPQTPLRSAILGVFSQASTPLQV